MEQSGTIHLTREEKTCGPRVGANIVVTLMQPETAPLMAKRAQNHLAKVRQSTPKQDSKKSKPERKKHGKHQRVDQLQQAQLPDELSSDVSIFTLFTPKRDKK